MRWRALLALLAALWGCSGADRVDAPPAKVVFVEKGQIIKDTENPGWYRVTEGWLAERLRYEQALQAALAHCKENKDELPD